MGNIVLLDDLTINKIAAGEVIERPASVVKELVENSIDAGSKNITVEIKNGGISMIKITDDGMGIAEDDMEIAFERHATSKIRRAEDLAFVTSMGFRGEALASIAAISRVEMISKRKNDDIAHKIVVEGGKTIEFSETARKNGTTITVENLFYNTPVRYKFLKKDYTESGYVEDVVNRIALVNLNVAIKLISNGKTIIQTSGRGDIKQVIYSIYGKDTAIETVDVDYEYEEIRISGVVGNPVIARSNRSNQLFFLNGRYIKDKSLTAAVDQAFKGIVPVGRYGFAILNIHMDPKSVDVNVHPAKLEVRFEDESKVFKAVYHAIKSCLTTVNNTKDQMQDTFDFMNSFNQNKKDFKSGNTTPFGFKKSKYDYNYDKSINDNWNNRYSADSIGNNSINKYDFENKKIEEDKKSSGIVGLFKKIIKEPDETEDEINNNYLADIYKSSYGLGKGTEITIKDNDYNNNIFNNQKTISSNNTLNINNNFKENNNTNNVINSNINNSINNGLNGTIQNSTNDKLLNKSIVLGDALISSNTMQINLNDNENKNSANDIVQTVVDNDIDFYKKDNVLNQENNNAKENNEAFKRVIENNAYTQEIMINHKLVNSQNIESTDSLDVNDSISGSYATNSIDTTNTTYTTHSDYITDDKDKTVETNNLDNTSNIPNDENNETVEITENTGNTENSEMDGNTGIIDNLDYTQNITNADDIEVTGNNFDDNLTNEVNTNNLGNSTTTNEVDINKLDNNTTKNEDESVSFKYDLKQNTSEIYLNNTKTEDSTVNFDFRNDLSYQKSDNENNNEDNAEERANTIDTNDNLENDNLTYDEDIEKNINSENIDSFEKNASEIIEAKMQLDSTQMIDTKKIRDSLNENEEEQMPEFEEMYKKTFGIETFSQRKEKELENLEKQKRDMSNAFEFVNSQNINTFEDDENYKIPYKYIGIAFDNYIIIEIKDEIYIVNHISANGKIIYEQLINNYFNNEEIDENQFLLLPDIISLTDKETYLARENMEMFAKAGFIYEEFGNNTIKLVSVPSICEKLNTKQLFTDILNELDKVAITEKEEKASKFLATIADKVSSRVSDRLDNDLAKNIIDDLLGLKDPFGDLLGKAVAIKMTKSDLEKKFSRK